MGHGSVARLNKIMAREGEERFGDMVWWHLSCPRIARKDLLNIWADHGLNEGLLPDEPTPEKSLKTAIKENNKGLGDHLVRLSFESDDVIAFSVQKETKKRDGNKYDQEALVEVKKDTGKFTADDNNHPIVARIRGSYDSLLSNHTADDLRRAVTSTLHSFAAVTLRSGGGIYWIPQPFADKLRQLTAAVKKFGGSTMYLVPVTKTPEAEDSLKETAKGALESDLTALQEELEKFVADPPKRDSTLSKRLVAYEELRNKAHLYQTILGLQVNDLNAGVKKLETQMSQLIGARE